MISSKTSPSADRSRFCASNTWRGKDRQGQIENKIRNYTVCAHNYMTAEKINAEKTKGKEQRTVVRGKDDGQT
jgi:hypothetical protein